jgi:hypothetical protein
MIHAVHGKSIYSEKAATTEFEELVSPSQEAFTMLLYRNGYKNWLWVHNICAMTFSSEESESDERPPYQYTMRSRDLTSRNGGWPQEGNDKYVELYDRVKQDRIAVNGAFKKKYMTHWMEKKQSARKHKRHNNTPTRLPENRDDMELLVSAWRNENDEPATVADEAPDVTTTAICCSRTNII